MRRAYAHRLKRLGNTVLKSLLVVLYLILANFRRIGNLRYYTLPSHEIETQRPETRHTQFLIQFYASAEPVESVPHSS